MMAMTTMELTQEDRHFLAYALDQAAAHLADTADQLREEGRVDRSVIDKLNADEDTVRDWITKFDPDYVG
jgi:hypothetical protein